MTGVVKDSQILLPVERMTEEEGLSHGPSSQGSKTSALATQLNIMNTVMGVAILSLPSVFYPSLIPRLLLLLLKLNFAVLVILEINH